jgi:hypothetical protein
MRHTRSIVLAAFAAATLIAIAAPAQAGDEARAGTAGAGILQVPVGPRGTALSGAVVANATGVEALYWNPAGITAVEGTEAMFSTMDYLIESRIHFVGVTHTFENIGSFGVSAKALSFGDIAVTTEEAGGPTGEIYSPTFSVIALSYGRQVSERAHFGLSAQLVSESVRSVGATGVAFDLGFQYNSPWKGVRFGAVMKNFGPKMSYEGSDFGQTIQTPDSDPSASGRTLVTESASYDLPASFQLGAVYSPLGSDEMHKLDIEGAFQSNTFATDAYRLGAEYGWQDQLFLRAGIMGREDNDDVWNATFGAGVHFPLGETDLMVDYALQTTSDFFDDLNLISLKVGF